MHALVVVEAQYRRHKPIPFIFTRGLPDAIGLGKRPVLASVHPGAQGEVAALCQPILPVEFKGRCHETRPVQGRIEGIEAPGVKCVGLAVGVAVIHGQRGGKFEFFAQRFRITDQAVDAETFPPAHIVQFPLFGAGGLLQAGKLRTVSVGGRVVGV